MARIITVDFTGVEIGGGRVRVPEGDYGLKIKQIKTGKGEESKKPKLEFFFLITQGHKRGIGKVIRHTCSLQPQALWNLHNVLSALGKDVGGGKAKFDLDKMIGKELAATIQDDEPYEGKVKSMISNFFPIDDLGNTSESGDELEEGVESEDTTEEGGEEEDLFNQEETKPARKGDKKKPTKKKKEEVEEEEEAEEEQLF